MKAMEEEVLIKKLEIGTLRDSLHQTESILEEEKISFSWAREKTQALSEKEKEFSKKGDPEICFACMASVFACLLISLEAMPKVAYKSPRKISAVVCWKYFFATN